MRTAEELRIGKIVSSSQLAPSLQFLLGHKGEKTFMVCFMLLSTIELCFLSLSLKEKA